MLRIKELEDQIQYRQALVDYSKQISWPNYQVLTTANPHVITVVFSRDGTGNRPLITFDSFSNRVLRTQYIDERGDTRECGTFADESWTRIFNTD